MADNVVANPGSGGATFATDQDPASEAHYPLTKLVFGPLDTFTVVTASAGLPVQPSTGAVFTVSATNLDTRDLAYASDSVTAHQGGSWTVTANAGTGPWPVTDNGGSLTVDGTVAATQSGTWTVQPGNTANTTPWLMSIHDGTTLATVRNLAANDALNVAIVDASGNQITSFGGGGGTISYNPGSAALTGASISIASSGDNTVIAASPSYTTRVYRLFLVAAAAVNVILKAGSASLTGAMSLSEGGAIVLDFDAEPWATMNPYEGFTINLSAAVQVSGRVYYTQTPP